MMDYWGETSQGRKTTIFVFTCTFPMKNSAIRENWDSKCW